MKTQDMFRTPLRDVQSTVYSLFRARASAEPQNPALICGEAELTYGALLARVNRLANLLLSKGVERGDRVAILSHNRNEYMELEFAAAAIGAIVACLNWRLANAELAHCISLVEPRLIICESEFLANLKEMADAPIISIGDDYESRLSNMSAQSPETTVDPEDGLIILYTSGTTGLPKGAVISHRAMIARSLVWSSELGIMPDEAFIAWSPLFHMSSTDHALATLLRGGLVIVVDGYKANEIIDALGRYRIGWLALIPGMIDDFINQFRKAGVKPLGIRVCGAMADLVPPHQLAEVTKLLDAPYFNTFGSTETGLPPASRALIKPGEMPMKLSKTQSAFCEIRLVDADDEDVAPGEPGELAIRGPTVFSGYWNAPETNAEDFRNGWFHLGDVFKRNEDGSLDFVDRAKYLIKTGGENVYPAEIERVLLADSLVTDAAVVKAYDERWGETPIAFVSRSSEDLTADNLMARCKTELAGYKRPKEIRFIDFDDFPRSTSGKVQRHLLEDQLKDKKG